MFGHAGFRPLWPVIFFLPWFFLGIAYLFESVLRRRARTALIRRTYDRDQRLRFRAHREPR